MRILNQYNEKDLIFFDIETVRVAASFKELSPDMVEAWLYKARYSNEVNKKTGEVIEPEDYYSEKAALYAPFAKIVCIVAGRIVDDDKLNVKKYVGEESALLKEFNEDLGKVVKSNITAFCGFNNIGFDQPFVAKRMIVNGVTPHEILDTAHMKPWEIRCVDLSVLWKGTSFYQDSLVAVAAALGLPSPKSNMTGGDVSDAFYKGRINDIANYCVMDVLTTANIFRKFKGKSLLSLK